MYSFIYMCNFRSLNGYNIDRARHRVLAPKGCTFQHTSYFTLPYTPSQSISFTSRYNYTCSYSLHLHCCAGARTLRILLAHFFQRKFVIYSIFCVFLATDRQVDPLFYRSVRQLIHMQSIT